MVEFGLGLASSHGTRPEQPRGSRSRSAPHRASSSDLPRYAFESSPPIGRATFAGAHPPEARAPGATRAPKTLSTRSHGAAPATPPHPAPEHKTLTPHPASAIKACVEEAAAARRPHPHLHPFFTARAHGKGSDGDGGGGGWWTRQDGGFGVVGDGGRAHRRCCRPEVAEPAGSCGKYSFPLPPVRGPV